MLQDFLTRKPIGGDRDGLRRTLGATDLLFLGVGATVGAGLFSLTGIAAADYAGPAVVLSLLVAALGCTFTGSATARWRAWSPPPAPPMPMPTRRWAKCSPGSSAGTC